MSANLIRASGGNLVLANPALALGSGSAFLLRITNAITFSVKGLLYSKAATDNIAGSVTGTTQSANTTRLYAFDINAAGTVSCVAGKEVTNASVGTFGTGIPLPEVATEDKARLGYAKVVTAGSTFVPGTTSFAGISTFYNTLGDVADPALFL